MGTSRSDAEVLGSDGDDLAAVVVQDEHLRRPHQPARPALLLLTAVLLDLLFVANR